MKPYSYTDLCLTFDDRKEKSTPFFSHIVTLCENKDRWWDELDMWWFRMNGECRKLFLRHLHENDSTKYLFHLIDNNLKL